MDAQDDVLSLHGRAVAVAQGVIDGIGPEQLAAPTPCAEWDVRALLGHLVSNHRILAASASGGEIRDRGDADVVGPNPSGVFADSANRVAAVLGAPGALDRTFRMPWGEVPGKGIAWSLTADAVIHAWDLARATGQAPPRAPDFCEAVLAWGRTVMRDARRVPHAGQRVRAGGRDPRRRPRL